MSKSSVTVSKIDSWIDSMEAKFLNSASMGKAIYYYNERRTGLQLFLTDVNASIDNNQAERKQRFPVMGRKNFLHFKSINGAYVATFFYSVIESCKSNGLNASSYIFEMGIRSAEGRDLESPYLYSKRFTEKVKLKLSSELEALVQKSEDIAPS